MFAGALWIRARSLGFGGSTRQQNSMEGVGTSICENKSLHLPLLVLMLKGISHSSTYSHFLVGEKAHGMGGLGLDRAIGRIDPIRRMQVTHFS